METMRDGGRREDKKEECVCVWVGDDSCEEAEDGRMRVLMV